MSMKQCANGHLYDEEKNTSCPYCAGKSKMGKSIPLNGGIPKTESLKNVEEIVSEPIPETKPFDNDDFGKTQFIDESKNSEIKPVKGWLVVLDGEKNGLDFRIHSGQNKLGRSRINDILIDFDKSISNDACCILYDNKSNMFYIKLADSKNNIYVNETWLIDIAELHDNDIIKIGETKLLFKPLFNDEFIKNNENTF